MAVGPSHNRRGLVVSACVGAAAMLALVLVLHPVLNLLQGGSKADALEPGGLTILSGTDDSLGRQRVGAVARWNRDHPDHPVTLREISSNADDQHSEMVAQAQSSGDFDIYNLDVTWVAEFAAAHYVQPLDGIDTSDFLRVPLATGMYADKRYALPYNTDVGLLYYRSDLVDPPPGELPPTRSDADRALSRNPGLAAAFAGQYRDYEGLTVNALEAIWAQGGDVVDRETGAVTIDSGATQRAMTRLAAALGKPAPGQRPDAQRDYDETTSTAALVAGKVAMMRNWPVQYAKIQEAARQDKPAGPDLSTVRLAKLPGHSALGGQDLAIAATTDKPRLAKAVIEYLTSADNEKLLFGEGGLPAVRNSTYTDPAVTGRRPYAGTVQQAVADAYPRPITSHYALFSTTFRKIVNEALNDDGNLPPDARPRLAGALLGQTP
jgi:multiple sugar transport system substrate-binding protein